MPTSTHWQALIDTQTTPCFTQTYRLLPFLHRLLPFIVNLNLWTNGPYPTTDYSPSHSDIQTTPIHCQSESWNQWTMPTPHTDYSLSHSDTQTTAHILTQTHLILHSFLLRHTENPNLLSIWIFKPIDHDHPPPTGRCWLTHKLLLVSLRHTDYFHFYTDIPNIFILT